MMGVIDGSVSESDCCSRKGNIYTIFDGKIKQKNTHIMHFYKSLHFVPLRWTSLVFNYNIRKTHDLKCGLQNNSVYSLKTTHLSS